MTTVTIDLVQIRRSSTSGFRPGMGGSRPLSDGEQFVNDADKVMCVGKIDGTFTEYPVNTDAQKAAPGNPLGDGIAAAATTATLPGIPLTATLTSGFDVTASGKGGNVAAYMGFGGGFFSRNNFHQNDSSTHVGESRATFSFTRAVAGSGANGPGQAGYCAFFGMSKYNYLTSTTDGEIDGWFTSVKQGAKSDCGGGLIDIRKVFNLDANDSGGAVALETTTARITQTGAVIQSTQVIVGFAEGAGGASSNTGYGFYSEATTGGPYSAFHASQINGAVWQNFFTAHYDRTAANIAFRIDGTGHVRSAGGSAGQPAYGFQNDPTTGFYRLSASAPAVSVGGVGVWYWNANGHFVPQQDGIRDIGESGGRIRNYYGTSSAIITSDQRLKTDIRDCPLGLDFLKTLKPKGFRYTDGNSEIVYDETTEEYDEPITKTVTNKVERTRMDGAVFKRWFEDVTSEEPVYDEIPVLNEDKTPVIDTVVQRTLVLDDDGQPVKDENGADVTEEKRERRPRVLAVPRTRKATRIVRTPRTEIKEGSREHLGFLAQDVRAALVAAGADNAAMWSLADPKDPESRQALRVEHLIAPLVVAVQDLSARLAKLEATQ